MNVKFILPVRKVKPAILSRARFLASGISRVKVRANDPTGFVNPDDS